MLLKWFARWCFEINIVLMSGIYCDVPKIKRKLRICTYAYLPITTPRTDIEIGNANHFNRRKDNHILKTLCVSRRTSAAGITNFFLPNLTFLLEYVLLFYGHQGKDLVHQLSWNWFFESTTLSEIKCRQENNICLKSHLISSFRSLFILSLYKFTSPYK